MNNAIGSMRVQPVKAAAIGCDTNPLWNDNSFAIDVDREVGMNVKATLLHTIARDAINRGIVWVAGNGLNLPVDKANQAKQNHAGADRTPQQQAGAALLLASLLT